MLEKFSLDSLKDMSKDELLDLIAQINNIPEEVLIPYQQGSLFRLLSRRKRIFFGLS